MSLEDKLKKLQGKKEDSSQVDWGQYKKDWKKSIDDLYQVVMSKWYGDLEQKGLMVFSLIPTKRIEPNVGEYITMTLEISLAENKTIVLEPVATMTTNYNGKIDFYMRGNVYKRLAILREINEKNEAKWIVARSYDETENFLLTKEKMDKIIEGWLS